MGLFGFGAVNKTFRSGEEATSPDNLTSSPDYEEQQADVPAGYKPLLSSNSDYSKDYSPTIASQSSPWNWNQFGQDPKGYAIKQGLSAAGVPSSVSKWATNPIGSATNALFGKSLSTPISATDAATSDIDGLKAAGSGVTDASAASAADAGAEAAATDASVAEGAEAADASAAAAGGGASVDSLLALL